MLASSSQLEEVRRVRVGEGYPVVHVECRLVGVVDDPLVLDGAIRRDLGDRVEAWRRRAEPYQEGANLAATTRNGDEGIR